MLTTVAKSFTLIAIGLVGLLLSGALNAMPTLNDQPPLTNPWKERFQDVKKLNDYAKTRPVDISNAMIEGHTIDGAVLNGGQFQNTHWKSVSAKKLNLTKLVFRKGRLDGVDFSNSTLTDVVFEDMMLREVRFFDTTLNNVRFIRCTFNGSNIDGTKTSRIEVTDSTVVNTSFSDGQLMAVFRNSKLTKGNELTSLKPPSALTFVKSELSDVDLSRSTLNELVLDTIKSDNSGFDGGTIGKVTITGGDISFGFTETQIEQFKVHNINSVGLAIQDAVVKTMVFNDCRSMKSVNLFHARIGTIDFTNCPLSNFRPRQATIDTLRVNQGSILNSAFEKMKAKMVILENVSLDGELNFTDAHIGELKTKNVTKQPGLNLITTGSNVTF